jgi:hypothetical protein
LTDSAFRGYNSIQFLSMLSSSASRSAAKWQKRCKLNGLTWKLGTTKDFDAPFYGEWSSQATVSARVRACWMRQWRQARLGWKTGLKRRRYVPTATLAWFCIGAQRVSDEHQPCEANASTRPVATTPLLLGSEFTLQKAPGTFFWLWPCFGS